jgi:hypothetical protein
MLYKLGNGQIKIGSVFGIGEKLSNLGGKNYLIKVDKYGEYYLVETSDFKLPSKIYGDVSVTKRWLDSYDNNSHKNLGILLSGLKGSGKTILAQKLCVESKKPVLILTEAYYGSDFIEFLSSPVFEDCIIFIDEFEKIYPKDKMPIDLLSLFDGNFTTRLIFLVTVNNINLVNEYMINRPGRIKYRKHYDNLEQSVIDEVLDDLLINKDHADSLLRQIRKLGIITFDILISIIKDMNLFNESADLVLKHLNISSEPSNYQVFEKFNENSYKCSDIYVNLYDETHYIDITRTDHNILMRSLSMICGKLFKHGQYRYLELEEKDAVKQYILEHQTMTIDEFNYISKNENSHISLSKDSNIVDEYSLRILDIEHSSTSDIIKIICEDDLVFLLQPKQQSPRRIF